MLSRDVGGGFGAKIDTYPETIMAAALAMRLNRPVRWVEERQEEFTSTIHGRGEVQYVEAAYRNDGKLLALRTRYYTDLGAYSFGGTHGVAETLTPSGAAGAYTVENLEWTVFGVYTNKMTVGPYRGYGQHATAYAAEVVMDAIARTLALDPAEVRRRNLIPTGAFPYRTPTGRLHDSGDYHRGLEMALELANYAGLRAEQARLRERGELLGIGIATTVDASGFGPSGALSVRPGYETSMVQVDTSGRVTVYTGSSPHGQAHETTFAQIAADELGVPLEDVSVIYGDTALIAQGTGTRASRSLVVGGSAVVTASRGGEGKGPEDGRRPASHRATVCRIAAGRFLRRGHPRPLCDVARRGRHVRRPPAHARGNGARAGSQRCTGNQTATPSPTLPTWRWCGWTQTMA